MSLYTLQYDLYARFYGLELHTAAVLLAWLYRPSGINTPANVLSANCLAVFRRRLETHLFIVAFADRKKIIFNVASASVSHTFIAISNAFFNFNFTAAENVIM